MKVSILVPAKGRPGFLREALASCAHQQYPQAEFEVICVHDGPTLQPAPRWEAEARFVYDELERPAGQSVAINRAFSLSAGEYLTVCQDDDFIYPQKLAALAAALDADPRADAVYSLPMHVDEDGRERGCPESVRAWLKAHPWVRWRHLEVGDGLRLHGTSTMYRRALWERCGLWDEKLWACEEYEFHLRLLFQGAAFKAVNEVLSAYRIHPLQKSRRDQRRLLARKQLRAEINARFRSVPV